MKRKKILLVAIFVGIFLVSLEFLFIRFELFDYLPHIGVVLHIIGGLTVCFFFNYLFFKTNLKVGDLYRSIFLIGCVCLSAVLWEGFEWILGYILHIPFQSTLDNTMLDLYTGITGGILGLFALPFINKFVSQVI